MTVRGAVATRSFRRAAYAPALAQPAARSRSHQRRFRPSNETVSLLRRQPDYGRAWFLPTHCTRVETVGPISPLARTYSRCRVSVGVEVARSRDRLPVVVAAGAAQHRRRAARQLHRRRRCHRRHRHCRQREDGQRASTSPSPRGRQLPWDCDPATSSGHGLQTHLALARVFGACVRRIAAEANAIRAARPR